MPTGKRSTKKGGGSSAQSSASAAPPPKGEEPGAGVAPVEVPAAVALPQQKKKPALPVTILTGYLGAGKTTLLNYLLHEQRDKKLAVIENEMGEVSIDDALVEQKHQDMAEELVLLENGCICCTIRNDLVETLLKIGEKYRNGQHLDGILIELTGVADPAPVVQTFFQSDDIRANFKIDNVIALVDAKHAIEKLDESKQDPAKKGTANAQIAFSSTVLLNKVDLVDEEELPKIEARIKSLNTSVEIIRCQNAVVPVDKLFGVGAFNLGKVLEEQYMDEEEFSAFYTPKMDDTVSNVGVRCTGEVSMFLFSQFLDSYLNQEAIAVDFLRVKAVLNIKGGEGKYVVQAVHMLRNQGYAGKWAAGDPQENRIIFIGRNMQARRQELTEGFKACLAGKLRFKVGAKVGARTGDDEYSDGVVVERWDGTNAYRIQLKDGSCVNAPHDTDNFVRAR